MKLIPFTFTSEYDVQSVIQINPAYVVTLRPEGKTKTIISLASKAQITVDGTIDVVSRELCGDDRGGDFTAEHDTLTEMLR